jgi:hypothetical protein
MVSIAPLLSIVVESALTDYTAAIGNCTCAARPSFDKNRTNEVDRRRTVVLPPSQSEVTEIVSRRRREREAEAVAERLRVHSGPRCRTALFLHRLADRLAPELAAPSPGGALALPGEHRAG